MAVRGVYTAWIDREEYSLCSLSPNDDAGVNPRRPLFGVGIRLHMRLEPNLPKRSVGTLMLIVSESPPP